MSPPLHASPLTASRQAKRWLLGGRVQGVGFRPFVYRLAQRYNLSGWVRNLCGRVEIVAEGHSAGLERFAHALLSEAPSLAKAEILSCEHLALTQDSATFRILPSLTGAADSIHLPPDYFLCADCLAELQDPADRRYRYPFINCTQCGPRYTVIHALPYDRVNTTLAGFALCAACREEYDNPRDRRFHAEPLACPACGPQPSFHAPGKTPVDETPAALATCVAALREGRIVAVKGIGGYHLMCDARSDSAVQRLRASKPRPHKPLAVMFPLEGEDGLDGVRGHALVGTVEARALLDPARLIVLIKNHSQSGLSRYIAPGLDETGALLPYSPLHHILLEDFGAPLVATSANVSGEPVLTDNGEAQARLAHVADAFLHHNRPIARPADDAVVRVIAGKPRVLRLGRGLAPLELPLPFTLPHPLLACGAHIKNTVALAWNNRVVISPHIGDLGSARSLDVFEQVIADLQALYGIRAEILICD
ncbi:MAG: carbamoyltransferase HypF, partial [Gammaproteobacteria bacterium]